MGHLLFYLLIGFLIVLDIIWFELKRDPTCWLEFDYECCMGLILAIILWPLFIHAVIHEEL